MILENLTAANTIETPLRLTSVSIELAANGVVILWRPLAGVISEQSLCCVSAYRSQHDTPCL
jgi:hypothetical protein